MTGPQNSKSTKIIAFIAYLFLVILGFIQIFTDSVNDGITNLLISSLFTSIFFNFDYKKLQIWQKALLILYTLAVIGGSIYLVVQAFV